MNSKQRVQAAFAHAEPDRVPLNYLANPGIDGRLKEHFGLAPDDGEGLRQALGVDFRGVGAPYTGPRLHAEIEGLHVEPQFGLRTRWVEHESGGYWDYVGFPLREATLDDVEAWPMPTPDDYDYSAVAPNAERWGEYAIVIGGAGYGDIMNSAGMIFGTERVYLAMAGGDEAVFRYVDRRLGLLCEIAERTLEAAGTRIDCLWLGEDLGTQRGPLISLASFREHIRPRHQKFVDVGKHHGVSVMIHCCGSSSWAFEDFIEMGIDVVDTLQPEAADMSPRHLKDTYGDRLAFHGCMSTAGPVATGSVDDVVRTVHETLEIMMPGGGYVLAPTHQLQDNSPTENVLAMYDTAHELGRY